MKKHFVFEWGSGMGMKFGANEYAELGFSVSQGQTYNNGEWKNSSCKQ